MLSIRLPLGVFGMSLGLFSFFFVCRGGRPWAPFGFLLDPLGKHLDPHWAALECHGQLLYIFIRIGHQFRAKGPKCRACAQKQAARNLSHYPIFLRIPRITQWHLGRSSKSPVTRPRS